MKNILSDRELWFVLAFNGFLAWGYKFGYFSLDTLVWIYYFQSILIGISNVVRMIFLKRFTTKNFQINGQSVEPVPSVKNFSALFFALHYGFFHFVYFIFLVVGSAGNGSKLDFRMVLINVAVMFGNMIVSTWSNILKDREEPPAMAGLFFIPYLRVVPMHIFIILGIFGSQDQTVLGYNLSNISAFWLFLWLKIVSDVIMHIVVQKSWRSKRPKPLEGYI